MTRRPLSWMGLAWLGVLLACCMGPTFVVQQYAGPPRPRDAIAIVRVNGDGPRLTTLDRDPLLTPEKDSRFHIEVLPGVHEIEVDDPQLGFNGGSVRFVTEPGKVYRVVVRSALLGRGGAPGFVAQVFEVDRASDAELQPVPLVSEAPPPLPPPRPSFVPPALDAGALDAAGDGDR